MTQEAFNPPVYKKISDINHSKISQFQDSLNINYPSCFNIEEDIISNLTSELKDINSELELFKAVSEFNHDDVKDTNCEAQYLYLQMEFRKLKFKKDEVVSKLDRLTDKLSEKHKIVQDTPLFTSNTIPQILITPIRKTKNTSGPCSKTDWEEQMLRSSKSEQMMWDDSKRNASCPGDIFIVCRNNISVSFHRIEKILPPTNRLSTWAKNIGQSNRNVIYISPEFTNMTWDEWLKLDGAKKIQGTTAVKQNRKQILNALKLKGHI